MATPARKITNTGSKKNIGKFFSFKMQSLIWYESLNERDYMYLLEIDPDVVDYRSQPLKISYTLNNQLRRYTPDFLVQRSSRKQIVEIKPEKRLNQEQNLQLFQAITNLGQSQDWEFIVITDKMIKMTRVRFATGLHLWLHNREYVIKQKAENRFQLLDESTLQTTWLTEKQLVQSFFAHELTLNNPVENQTIKSYQEADYVQIPDSLKAKAERKEKYINTMSSFVGFSGKIT